MKTDINLVGIYVKRCKCGLRPYYDRIAIYPMPQWIACNCGKVGQSAFTKEAAINNWNNNKLVY